jgi:dolichol-phosphate mannosyltransferase
MNDNISMLEESSAAPVSLTNKSLSVVIACYRDGGSILEMYRLLKEYLPVITPNYEIIFVNDASPDDAEEKLEKIALEDNKVVVVNHTRNFGSQNAFISGMSVAKGDAVVLMDGDLQDPPRLIPELAKKWLEGYEIIYGQRVKRIESLSRQLAYKTFYRLFRRMAPFSIPLDAGDFSLMDRKVYSALLTNFKERLTFLRGLRAYTGYKSIGVPYIRDMRYDGTTTNSLRNNINWAKLAIFSFSKKPLEYISFIALLCIIASFLIGVYFFISYILHGGKTPSGFMTILLILLSLGGINLLCLSIIAEYIGHIYDEVKYRPRYIIRKIIDNRGNLHD